jgi:signal peptidase II
VPFTDDGKPTLAEGAASQEVPPGPPRLALFATVAALALSADVVSKVVVVATISPLQPKRLLGGAVYLVLARNGGAAFSVGPSATILFTAVAVVVISVLVRIAGRLRSVGWAIALGLVLGGALGNLIDRLARSPGIGRGHVVDWISLFANDGHVWPIFNLADSAIVSGGVLAAVLAVRGIEFSGARSVDR